MRDLINLLPVEQKILKELVESKETAMQEYRIFNQEEY